jgi:hypothetical protein
MDIGQEWRLELQAGQQRHTGPFGGVSWALERRGVSIAGAPPEGTRGPPSTALRVWNTFGAMITAASRAHDVPVELIVALICNRTVRGKLPRVDVRHIESAAAILAMRYWLTNYDPPLVAAAYYTGGLYCEEAPANRWRLRCYPAGTGACIDRWVAWFNDAMRLCVAAERAGDAPSFVTAFGHADRAGVS